MPPTPYPSEEAHPVDENRRRRILFRATHRGTYENDLLIGTFVRERLDRFTTAELDALEEVMELPDADLSEWLTGREPIPASVDTPMLRAIREAALERSRRGPELPA
jgi:antitoxin CptB